MSLEFAKKYFGLGSGIIVKPDERLLKMVY